MTQVPDEEHFRLVGRQLLAGAVVPFLGAGVNACSRPTAETGWAPGSHLPGGQELAAHLAREFDYPHADGTDLSRVAQYVDVMLGNGPLYESLQEVFDADYSPTPVHRLLALLPALIREHQKGCPRFYPLIVTTNYDDVLERAFDEAGEAYDLVTYVADGPQRGKFVHRPPGEADRPISVPNTYSELRCDERPVIAKIHGAVRREPDETGSYVITEDDYIAYLSQVDIPKLIPVNIVARMRKSHFLFLGYSLKDWNLRVILHRIWGDGDHRFNSWAIQPAPGRIDERSWYRRRVELLDAGLEDYIAALRDHLVGGSDPTVPPSLGPAPRSPVPPPKTPGLGTVRLPEDDRVREPLR